MAYLGRSRKDDLKMLATELGLAPSDNLKIIDLKDLIIKSDRYDEEFVKGMLHVIVEERTAAEQQKVEEEEKKQKAMAVAQQQEREFELEKMKIQLEMQKLSPTPVPCQQLETPKLEFSRLIPRFKAGEDEMGLYLTIFERQAKFLNIPENTWIAYLIGSLPPDIAQLIAREDEDDAQNYEKVKGMLLKRFRVTGDRFRQYFSQQKKNPDSTWRDFYFEISSYLEGWIKELKITTFDQLKSLMIADQIKRKTPANIREHFLDIWADLNDPLELAERLDSYDSLRPGMKNNPNQSFKKKEEFRKPLPIKKSQPVGRFNDNHSPVPSRIVPKFPSSRTEGRNPIQCYGCGTPGVIKSKCPTCTKSNETETVVNCMTLFNLNSNLYPSSLLVLKIFGENIAVCADTGASHTIAGEKLFKFLKDHDVTFTNKTISFMMADGIRQTIAALSTVVDVYIEGKVIPTEFLVLPEAKGNKTLLGLDFLNASRIVLDVQGGKWHFSENPREQYKFFKKPLEEKTLSAFELREDEGKHLSPEQARRLNKLLDKNEACFQPGGEPTPFIEHRIDTGDHSPIATSPYRMNPTKKEILKEQIEELLKQNIIEECESSYAAPVVLVPKPNGKVRLCVDYRKLNSVTKVDTYPLPRMDDLLNEATPTSYMSTIDLQSGYHQVKVADVDQDKTAFICPFGTYRYLRMPFGLRNAPATFQRLIDKFRSGLKDVFALSYLDDIIILSETFDKHLEDLEKVFERLSIFKLHANRDKCRFACDRVKYLGFWITKDGIEADQEKISAIQKIPAPTNVKEVQSFLQTCSWFRRYVPNFADIARPLSNLTKKRVQWHWGPEQQESFETLKMRLITSPILKQADGSKPFTIRTDASNYALGAVLLQGSGPDEHVIEYASRLLIPAEQNYSTTEREALAVVWALEKFRGYVENQQIFLASDHQPLKWLLSIKSPSGRLARWALKIQSFNLKIDYTPGKANVVADMLSRPSNTESTASDVCAVTVDIPTRRSSDIRKGQLEDEELKKIIDCFESMDKDENFANYTSRGYLMNQGVLYRYSPESEEEEAQLVVPKQERERILQEYHDAPTAGHYGVENTYKKIASRYYFQGMKKFITEYIKTCPECNRYKPTNQKPAGLLRTPAYAQRFETLAIDLFGPLPETPTGKKWIFIVEDTSTKWVELFALVEATAENCAKILVEEVFLRYGLPRRLISDNGPQFISAVMQQTCDLLEIKQDLIPIYHPQANPSERKNRDLKPRLAILVGEEHSAWEDKLSPIRFAMNTSVCDTTGHTAAYLQFGRQLRTSDDIRHDIRQVIDNDNFVPEITPYLKRFTNSLLDVKDRVEQKQDYQKVYFDRRRKRKYFKPGDKVWVTTHPISRNNRSRKFMPKREGPYIILTLRSPTTYEIADPANPDQVLGTYHISALKDYQEPDIERNTGFVTPLRKRGRPKKKLTPGSEPRRQRNQRGSL